MVKHEIQKKIRLAYARRLSKDVGVPIHTAHRLIKQYDPRAEEHVVGYLVEDGRQEEEARAWYRKMRKMFTVRCDVRHKIREQLAKRHGKHQVVKALGK